MLEKFTDRSKKVLALANLKAQQLNHEYLDTGHILLGLIEEGPGVGATVLKILDVDLGELQREVETLLPSAPATVALGKLPQTAGTKKAIRNAIQEARVLKHNYIGTEHLLLGLLAEDGGLAVQVLTKLGQPPERIRNEILNLLGSGPDEEIPPDMADRFRDHPLVQQYTRLIDMVSDQQDKYVKEGDYDRGIALRDQKYSLRQQLDALYRLLLKHPKSPT